MKICEIFFSIQGESSFSGLPCIFIRMSGCNLNCSWCDTPYHNENPREMSIDEILDKISEFNDIDLIEVTGGEPLLQPETVDLIVKLAETGKTILVETNGSISVADLPYEVHKIIDVKCPSSGESESFNRQNLLYIDPSRDELKFVIADRKDFEYARDFIHYNNLWGYKTLFSCVHHSLKPDKLIEWILAEKLPVRFQLQMHKYIWDENERER